MNLLLAFGIGIVAGMRSMTAPALIAWAAHLGWLHLQNSFFAFMGSTWAVVILSIFAIAELIADQLPKTPPRTAPLGLTARIATGGLERSMRSGLRTDRPVDRRRRRRGRSDSGSLRRIQCPHRTGANVPHSRLCDCRSGRRDCHRFGSVPRLPILIAVQKRTSCLGERKCL